jgi:glycerol-3-phosphate dehydrogenase
VSEGRGDPLSNRSEDRPQHFDVLVVGGGINGTGIARDAAGRALKVLLCEQDDLASHTSSASTKLIHGGLRYLEGFHFGLVRKALQEREVLLASAPHIMWPLRFVMPHDAHLRPQWMIRTGLFLYDNLAKRDHLAASASLNLRKHPAGTPLESQYTRGFIYSDGWTDDARLVVLNARDAADRGAVVLTRTRCEKIEPDTTPSGPVWRASLKGAHERVITARAVVNATGPWVTQFLSGATQAQTERSVRLVKGSHIVVPRIFQHRFAYIFQNIDRRIVFAIPYEEAFTLIGTTDVEHHADPATVRIADAEVRYLCDTVNRYFTRKIAPTDVVWSYSGVRPLLDDKAGDPSSVTRDYKLEMEDGPAPLLSVFGGKITTYRKLAESAVDELSRALRVRAPLQRWTRDALLPGGDLTGGSFARFLRYVERRYPWLPASLRKRYSRAYGTRISHVIGDASSVAGLGPEILPQLHEREIAYLQREEWALTAEDILWRRSKLGLHLPPSATQTLAQWLNERTRRQPQEA